MKNLNILSRPELIEYIKELETEILKIRNPFHDLKYEKNMLHTPPSTQSSQTLKNFFETGPYKSLRQFSKKIDLPPGKISQIFSNKRYLTESLISKIEKSKELPESTISKLRKNLKEEHLERKNRKKELSNILNNEEKPAEVIEGDSFCYMDDWTFYAVLALLEKKENSKNVDWIAKSLNISETKAKRTLDILLSIKLVTLKRDCYDLNTETNTYNSNKPEEANKALRSLTNSILQKGQETYNKLDFPMDDKADYINFSLLADPTKIPTARKMLTNYIYKVCQYLNDGDNKKVYYLTSQLFPISVENTDKR